MKKSKRTIQYILIILINALTIGIIGFASDELEVQSAAATIGIAIAFVVSQALYWRLFVNFFSFLPFLLYPLVTLILAGATFLFLIKLVPGVLITNVNTAIWITSILTLVNAALASLFSLDLESIFDRYVTRKMVSRRGNPIITETPGFIYLEIDGLGEKVFRRALDKGFMPTLKKWLDEGKNKITGWETDLTSQTGAMQAGILLGNNENIPAYRWWDRKHKSVVVSGNLRDAAEMEKHLSTGRGLLIDGGASRGNMFSGDASESLFTYGTMLDPKRSKGPGFYLYLASPFVVARLIIRFFTDVFREWWQALKQKIRKDKYIVRRRNFFYAFLRAAVGPFLQDLTTHIVVSDVQRGVPAIYAVYMAYDDIAHFAGMETPEAFQTLKGIDRYFARIERALKSAPRPYHFVILSDHGQSIGPTFQAAYGITLEELVKGSIDGNSKIFASLNTNEAWDNINAFLNESINANTNTAHILRTMLRSQSQNGLVAFGPERNRKQIQREENKSKDAQVIVLASGCLGLIYFVESDRRMTYEEIQERYPSLIFNLTLHPGIGFVLVRSKEHGDMVIGKEGIHFVDKNLVEGSDPLCVYSANVIEQVKRESSFYNCPDILVNTRFDPVTEELCGFENQVSHHGGLGGPQNHPFLFYPAELPMDSVPLVGATSVHHLLKKWRSVYQSDHTPPEKC